MPINPQSGSTYIPPPRKMTPGPANLDPQAPTNPQLAGPDTAPSSIPVPKSTPAPGAVNQMPGGATAIQQLPDGVGGAVTVPPTSMAPPSVIPPSIGPRPVATADNWQNWGAANSAYEQAASNRDNAAQAADNTTGYSPFETQEQLNVRRGLSINPANGSWDRADERAPYVAPQPTPQGSGEVTDVAAYLKAINTPGSPEAQRFAPPGYTLGANGWALNGSDPAIHTNTPGSGTGAPPGTPGSGIPSPQARPLSSSGGASDITPSIPNGAQIAPAGGGAATGAPASTFDENHNLIDAQINPTASPRLMKTQGMTDEQINKVLNGPDRVALGERYYDTFAKRAKGNFDRSITDATNAGAAHGQIGSGQLTNRYGDLAEKFNLDNTTAASDFAANALQGTIADNLNNYGVARNAENSAYGQDVNNRNEVRGERGYQQSLAEQAIARRIAQQQAEQGQEQQDFNNATTLYGLGTAPDPTKAYQTAAQQASDEAAAANGDVGALLRIFAARRNPVPVS